MPGGSKMKEIYRLLAIIFIVIVLTGLISAAKTAAQPGSCYLKANSRDVFVVVYELDRSGNMGTMIWQNRINQDQEVLITVPHARFRYFYNDNPDINQPLSGGFSRWCDGKRTVGVP